VIPGTHDTGTYNLSLLFEENTDYFPPWVIQILDFLEKEGFDEPERIVHQWSLTQTRTVYDSLVNGIRFLDIRLCWDRKNQMIRVHHSLMGDNIEVLLADIQRFMNEVDTEMIVIEIGGYDDLNDTIHQMALNLFEKYLGKWLYPRTKGFCTYGEMVKKGQLIIAVYEQAMMIKDNQNFWFEQTIFGDWADQDEYDPMYDFVKKDIMLQSGDPQRFYKVQWVLTASVRRVIEGFFPGFQIKSLYDLSRLCNVRLEEFINEVIRYRFNFIMTDFFEDTESLKLAQYINSYNCNDLPKYRWFNKDGNDCRTWAQQQLCSNSTIATIFCPLTCGTCINIVKH